MVYQSQSNAAVHYKAQSGKGSQASGSGGLLLRTAGGQYGVMTKAAYGSNEVRRDGQRTRGRPGSRRTAGVYDMELSLGVADPIIEAVLRGTWGSADVTIDESAMTSITTTTSTIVAAGGSWITQGVRVGDIVRLSGHATAANNDKNLVVTGATADTITVAGTPLTLNATPDTYFDLIIVGRKLVCPTAGNLVMPYFTIEEYEYDIDSSEVFTDCVWKSLGFSMQPDGIIMMNPGWVGTGQFETLSAGSAPLLTGPTEPTGEPMAVVDAALYYGGTLVSDLTAFDLTLDNKAAVPATTSPYGPDVFPGQLGISGSMTMLREDLSRVADFDDETGLSLHLLAVENEAEPKSFVSLFVPFLTLGGVAKSALNKEGGARTQTLQIPEELVGIDTRGGAYVATMVAIQVSNAT